MKTPDFFQCLPISLEVQGLLASGPENPQLDSNWKARSKFCLTQGTRNTIPLPKFGWFLGYTRHCKSFHICSYNAVSELLPFCETSQNVANKTLAMSLKPHINFVSWWFKSSSFLLEKRHTFNETKYLSPTQAKEPVALWFDGVGASQLKGTTNDP